MNGLVNRDAARILSEAICLNDLPATFTRATPAWHPYEKRLVASGERRKRNIPWGGGYQFPGDIVERASTNLLLKSEDFSDAAWSKTDVTVTADAALAPDNSITADLITEGSAGTALVQQVVTITASVATTWPVYVKLAPSSTASWVRLILGETTSNFVQAWFDLSTGTKGNTSTTGSGWSSPTSAIESVGGGWYRISVTATASTNTSCQFFVASTTGNGVSTRQANATYYLWGAQGASLGWASTYIPTTTAAATRNADDLTADLSGLPGGGLRRDEGTLLFLTYFFRDPATTGNARVFAFSGSPSLRCLFTGPSQTLVQNDAAGDQTGSYTATAVSLRQWSQYCGIFSTSEVAMWRGGNKGATVDTSLTPPYDAVTSLNIGRLGITEYIDGVLSLLYIHRALTPAEIATLAKAGGYYGV